MLPTAIPATAFAGTDAAPFALSSLTLTTFPTNATSIIINGTLYTSATFAAASAAARTLLTNANGNLAAGQSVSIDPSTGTASVLPFTVTDNQGATSTAASLTVNYSTPTVAVTGVVFEDVNYGGGVGRPYATANTSATGSGFTTGTIRRAGAVVELYDNGGNYVTATTTDATGNYTFTVQASSGYTVRVVNTSVSSVRAGYTSALVPVQTYNGTTTKVGGEYPNRADAAANTTNATLASLTPTAAGSTTAAESVAGFTTGTGATFTGPDFGYNFDTVVNTNDAGQGSLRQFINNSNVLSGEATLAQSGSSRAATAGAATTPLAAGVETSIFMIPNGTAVAGQLAGLANQFTATATGTAATISLTSAALPAITGSKTVIDGGTQTFSTGNSNAYSLATANAETTGPEVIINSNNLGGITVSASNDQLLSLGVSNANTAQQSGIVITSGATATLIQNNTVNNNRANITFGTTNAATASAATITGNVIRNSQESNADGIELNGGNNNMTISYNQILRNAGNGIDFVGTGGANTGNTITYNNISGNGTAGGGQSQLSGVAIRTANSNNNIISFNTFNSNSGPGIVAVTGTVNNTFSQNTFSGNGVNTTDIGTTYTAPNGRGLAIDLAANTSANGDGVTLNATDATRTGGNNLLNFPVLTTATVDKTNLVVSGYARPGNLVELYLAAPDPTGFGEGATYLTAFTQGAAVGTAGNVMTGAATTYSGLINGLDQGTDNTNTFTVTIPLSSLTPAQIAALQGGAAVLTSTATASGSGTSEFSGNLALVVADVTVSLTGPTTLSAGQPTGTFTATFTNEGPDAAPDVARSVTLPTGASLSPAQRNDLIARYAATFVTTGSGAAAVTTITFGTVALNPNANSVVTFAFTAPNTVSTTLALTAATTSASQGTNLAPDQATLTLSTVPTADVQVTSITPSATTTTGKFAVVFANNGPQNAAGVAYSVQLPTGLTGVAATNGGTYDGTTGLVSYSNAANTLTSGGTFASDITYALTTAPSVPVTATARVSTTTDEAGLTANNVQSATMPTQFDLTTTLSGPAAAVAGSPTMLYVTTTNLGPNTAPVATQTVTIPSATTLAGSIYITNGGMYAFSNGVGTVTFPALANVPGGQTITNSISFLAPGANFAPSATVSTTAGTETNPANNTAYLNGAAASTNVAVSTVAALSNEATTIRATTTVGGVTVPATVVDVTTPITYVVKSFNKGYRASTASATVVEQVQLLPGLTAATLKVGTATPSTLGNGSLSYANTAGTTTYNPTSGLLTYYQVTQAAGDSTTYDAITVTAPAAVGNGGQLLATASVQTTNFVDPVPSDNVASVAVRVRTKPDLATSVSGPSSTAAGLPATYVVRFSNSGTNDAATVTETVQLLAGLTGVTIADANGNPVPGAGYNSQTGLVTFPGVLADAVGTAQTYTIGLIAPGQDFPVTSTIASLTSDGVATNNSATQLTTVATNADLAVSVTGPATAVIGNPVTYVVTTTNNGPSKATGVTPTLQLPKNLTGVVVTGSASYNSGNGLVTFATAANLTPGTSTNSFVTFTMPTATATGDAAVSNGLLVATAAVSSTSIDLVAANNTAALTTSVAPATSDVADLATSVSRPNKADGTAQPSTVPAGTALTYLVAYNNTAGNTATNVVGTINLPPGLSVADLILNGTGTAPGTGVKGTQSGDIITFGGTTNGLPAGATYNQTTGLLTFPTFATFPASGSGNSYLVSFTAPARDVVVVSEITSSTSDNGPRLNYSNLFTGISANVDVATALSGPTTAQPGTTVTYAVTTVDVGPSPNPNSTTQTVTLPAGVVPTNYGSGTYANNTLTWTIATGQAPGAANAVVNTFSLVMPATGSIVLNASLSSAGENPTNPITGGSNTGNNTARLTTNPANQAPVAENIWNTLRGARSNDALALPISPLAATDADGTIDSYTVTLVPTQGGTLYYNGAAVTNNTPVTANGLSFVPAAGFVGNVTFSYVATDNAGAASPPALYTIPVAQDQEATYFTTPAKGGVNKYVVNDVLAAVVDPNTATYTTAGTVYDATTGTLLPKAANGLRLGGTNAVLAGTGPTGNAANTLPAGVSLNAATGQLFVSNVGTNGLANNPAARTYSVNITTTDSNGGLTTQTVNFTIGANPLPVVLTAFTAQAVQNRDALLSWTTASEVNSAYFDVERSLDGTSFVKIGQLAAKGNSTIANSYAFTDAGAAARATGAVYYRLRQVDLDATASYSPVRTVSFAKTAAVALSLYPNPAQNATTLDVSALPATGTYRVQLLDVTGRTVQTVTIGGGQLQTLSLSSLASGTYQVLVTGTLANGDALRQVLRLTKE